jgi:hypothetical protein
MPQDYVSFEILDKDTEIPKVINYYIVDMGRTYMYFRVSSTESVTCYYLLSLKGTRIPPKDEVKSE